MKRTNTLLLRKNCFGESRKGVEPLYGRTERSNPYEVRHKPRLNNPAGTLWRGATKGQAMTEVVLLLPVFIILLVFIVKIFALLILIQKMEIASYYAARRWQLQSHLATKSASPSGSPIDLMQYDIRLLKGSDKNSILEKVKGYIGFNDPQVKGFLNLQKVDIEVNRTMVWSVVTLTVTTDPLPQGLRTLLCKYKEPEVCGTYGQTCIDGYKYLCSGDRELTVIKYVPNRDRPLKFKLPGLE